MWEYYSTLRDCFLADSKIWFLEVAPSGESESTGCIFLTEEIQVRMKLRLKVLRSLDHMAFRLPAFMCAPPTERSTCALLARALRLAGRHLRADLLVQYRVEESLLSDWIQNLAAQGCAIRKRLFTLSPYMEPGEDFDAFCKEKRNILLDIRRRERRMNAENPGSTTMKHLWNVDLTTEDGENAWRVFQACRDVSWQKKWIKDSGRSDVSAVDQFYRTMAHVWGQRGWTSLQTLEIGAVPAAGQFWLVMPESSWLVVFAYDRQFSRHAPGSALMFRSLENWHARGGRFLEFGGESLGWKKDWATGTSDIWQVEAGLGTWKALLWAIAGKIRPKPERDMVRTGHENELSGQKV